MQLSKHWFHGGIGQPVLEYRLKADLEVFELKTDGIPLF